jgi:phospholipid-binding lipoprotein MlaA
MNRAIYGFNEAVDKAVMKPVAEGYREVMPGVVRKGVRNFYSNLDDVVVFFNDLLQLKLERAASDFGRIVWNSTVGILGFIDVATPMDMPKHNEDFGQTLGHYGVGTGPYLVLPFLGPSNFRDTVGVIVDYDVHPVSNMGDVSARNTTLLIGMIDKRESLLDADKAVEEAAIDKYQFVRDDYLQRRHSLVHDGKPPRPLFEEEDDQPAK